tara:strand:+ start:71 stop:211 length:141 start_codon:yes stop_codon:yes gene_type:complete
MKLSRIEPMVYLSLFAIIAMIDGYTILSGIITLIILFKFKLEFYGK